MYGVSLILAPLLFAMSSFFWIEGEYGMVGGTILFLSMVFWMPTLIFLFGLVKDKLPTSANWGFIGCHVWIYQWSQFCLRRSNV